MRFFIGHTTTGFFIHTEEYWREVCKKYNKNFEQLIERGTLIEIQYDEKICEWVEIIHLENNKTIH